MNYAGVEETSNENERAHAQRCANRADLRDKQNQPSRHFTVHPLQRSRERFRELLRIAKHK
jgi:hypothetical protein